MPQPEIAVLVSSYQRPGNLRRVLASLAAQRGVGGAFEVVVTDDGSRDQTPQIVQQFADSVSFPVRFVTHEHDGFQLARCRNEGVLASTAPYLLFLDGDCAVPPDHLRVHLDRRRERFAMAGYYYWLSREVSERIGLDEIASGQFLEAVTWRERLAMCQMHMRATVYTWLHSPTRPKLLGGNLALARADYERINGYDENFRGWGCEDDDVRLRLRAAGVRVGSIAWWTQVYHLWHPKTPSAPDTWRAGANVEYLRRPLRLTRCLAGLVRRELADLAIEIVGQPPARETIERLLPPWCRAAIHRRRDGHQRGAEAEPAEIQFAFPGGGGKFSARSDCRVLIIPRGESLDAAARELTRRADVVFADAAPSDCKPGRVFPLKRVHDILPRQLGALPLLPLSATSAAA
jgi:GT2 family glycosyltransferase